MDFNFETPYICGLNNSENGLKIKQKFTTIFVSELTTVFCQNLNFLRLNFALLSYNQFSDFLVLQHWCVNFSDV